jgi:hypothetical protein
VSKPRPLTDAEARCTIVARLGSTVDRARQAATRVGARPYRCFLVWTCWGGEEAGEGAEREVARVEILPTPIVRDLTGVALSPVASGVLPVGSLRVTEVSTLLTADQLTGKAVPLAHEDRIPEPYDFFYEVTLDARGDPQPPRNRYRLAALPSLDVERTFGWALLLERVSGDVDRHGQPQIGRGTGV